MVAFIASAAVVSAGVISVSPSKPITPTIPIVTANQIRLAAAIDPSTILTAVEELIQELASGDTYPLQFFGQEVQFAVNNVVLAADGALYGVTSSVGAVVENALGALLAPIGSTTVAHALYAAVSTLFENAVLPPSTLWNVGNFGLQPGTVLHNVVTIVERVLGAALGSVQALVTGLAGGSAASTAAVKSSVNSVAAVPKTGTKTTLLALNPTSSTTPAEVTKPHTSSKSDTSDKSATSTSKTKDDKGSHDTKAGKHASSSGTHGHSGHGSGGGHGGR